MVQITATKQISWDCVQVTLSMGSSFFVRSCYLQELPMERLVPQETLSELELEDLVDAGLAFSAEKAAVTYLEQRRLGAWVHNKTIQKARESFRVSQEQKEYLKSLKVLQ